MDEPYRCSQYEILEAMSTYGGSFVRKLVQLYQLADAENQHKLATTFENYFRMYDELAALGAARRKEKDQ